MKAISQLTSPCETENTRPAARKRGQLPSPPHDKKDSPKMCDNPAYSQLQLPPSRAAISKETFLPPQVTEAAVGHVHTMSATPTQQLQSIKPVTGSIEQAPKRTTLEETHEVDTGLYSYIEDPEPEYTVPALDSIQQSDGATKLAAATTKVNSTGVVREEEYTQMRPVSYLHPGASTTNPQLSSPESPMGVTKTLERLSRFKPDQMEHLINMLKTTIPTSAQGGSTVPNGPGDGDNPPPRPPKPPTTQNGPTRSEDVLTKSRERPSQLCLLTGEANLYDGQEAPSVYVNILPQTCEEGNTKDGGSVDKETKENAVPTLVVHSEPTDEESTLPIAKPVRKISQGLLTTAENTNAIKFKLGKLMKYSTCNIVTFLPSHCSYEYNLTLISYV